MIWGLVEWIFFIGLDKGESPVNIFLISPQKLIPPSMAISEHGFNVLAFANSQNNKGK